jgi:hypothetical protein
MRKEAIDNRFRFVLGPKAAALTSAACPPDDIPKSEHLDKAIEILEDKLASEKRINTELQAALTNLGDSLLVMTDKQAVANRGLIMMLGQCARELKVMRKALVLNNSEGPEESQQLLKEGVEYIVELRASLAEWRHREGIKVPEFDRTEEEKILDALIQSSVETRRELASARQIERGDDGDMELEL